jgi:glycosyltransferase involved in cell wall biosynthesis/2-polyprenyl-3-methyl-5-hydroxy-6-metoxy-1,4-benzoquinol methylase/Flp pilus assembly protein TadD
MSRLRILTFNFHEPYLCLMAKTGLDFTVGLYSNAPLSRAWHTQFRPIPPNMTLMEEARWREELEKGKFDVVVAHNESNALDLFKYDRTPKLLVCHNRRTFLRTTVTSDVPDAPAVFDRLLERLQERFAFVFISESKRADYGIPGIVILPGIDVEEFGGYSGGVAEVLRVGNLMRNRDLMFDVDFQEQACDGIPNRVVGVDPQIPNARPASSFEELLHLYRSWRCLLHVTREEYEDGYNLAMLEAMACGMPVVSLSNRTSPLTHGVDGFLSRDAAALRRHLHVLLADAELAAEIGGRGRETVEAKFPISAFVQNWRDALERAVKEGPRRVRRVPVTAPPRQRILLHYVASPITTGRYLERAARKKHTVVTTGLRCPEQVLDGWGFKMPAPAYAPHDVDLPLQESYREMLNRLPERFEPDLYLWVDSGMKEVPADIEALHCPKACYLIDTHVAPKPRIEIARHFDYTFLAQKAQVEAFRREGIARVRWLPLACSRELHDLPKGERIYDVSYVGGLDGDATDRRRNLVSKVKARFPNSKIGRYWPDEMAGAYAQSKIVFNACVNRDVNMRVFEAMASGALLITDEADGLEDLFEDGVHLVIYRDDKDALDVIDYYLRHDEDRERIALAGMSSVLERHTYDHRLQEIVDTVAREPISAGGYRGESRFRVGGYYRNTRPEVAQFVPSSVRRLLDVGCGGGDFGSALKKCGVKEVHGIEIVGRACEEAGKVLDKAILGNIEEMELPYEDGYFDCITFSDVLEHLRDPAAVLRKASRVLAEDGIVLMSIPNVRFHEVIAMLANGRWTYEDAGIMDRTHLRFFTAPDMYLTVKEAGLETLHLQALSYAPDERLPRNADGSVTLGRATLWPADDDDYRDLLTYQYIVIAGKPGANRLGKARDALRLGENEAAIILAEQARGVDECERRRIMAAAYGRLGQLLNAEKLYGEALSLRPDDIKAAGELGILLVAMNRPADAKAYLERALAADAQNERIAGALGLAHLSEERYEEAFTCLVAALEGSYDNVCLVPHLITVAERLGRLAEIAELLRRHADFHAGSADLACAFAALLAKLGKSEEARERLETVLLLNPGHAEARKILDGLGRESER